MVFVKVHIVLKQEVKYLVVVENLGDKRELDVLVKVVLEQHNGVVVELP